VVRTSVPLQVRQPVLVPSTHSAQEGSHLAHPPVLDVGSGNMPCLQIEHLVLEEQTLQLPSVHLEHLVLSASQKVPGAQMEHLPVSLQKRHPAGHSLQVPVASAKNLGLQALHL